MALLLICAKLFCLFNHLLYHPQYHPFNWWFCILTVRILYPNTLSNAYLNGIVINSIRLPSDSRSPSTPLPSAISFPLPGGFGTLTLEKRAPLGAPFKKELASFETSSFSFLYEIFTLRLSGVSSPWAYKCAISICSILISAQSLRMMLMRK